MGTSILKGITTGLLVTVLTLLAVLGATLAGMDKSIISYIVDFGLLLSCLASGYRASRNSGRILPAGLASGGYAIVGVLLLALYFPINLIGAIKIISEGTGLGLLAGVLGAGILSSDPDPYDYMETTAYPRREIFDRKDHFHIINKERPERHGPVSVSYMNSETSDFFGDSRSSIGNSEEERAKIYEICGQHSERIEEDEEDAFDWWRVETKKQLKSR
ncbi:MAG: hypothetical protein GX434_07105 [Peptococcaceae bacterium]|nr:hypothetical protein [Peptococcaceae bacterium]